MQCPTGSIFQYQVGFGIGKKWVVGRVRVGSGMSFEYTIGYSFYSVVFMGISGFTRNIGQYLLPDDFQN